MAIVKIKIHPAIGLARIGNSPDEFFIGPEKLNDTQIPQGGYKDAKCRVKRQAARFRLFAYDENDNVVQEVTAADADISWTVELANRKASSERYPSGGPRNNTVLGADREALNITPGPRTLNSPNALASFNNGTFSLPDTSAVTVPLGEIRTDHQSRLLVLGGFGNSGSPDFDSNNIPLSLQTFNNDRWYDDVADGPVTATVNMNGNNIPVTGAWVVVAPPKFAPQLNNVVSLYDIMFNLGVIEGWAGVSIPNTPSYTNDIYPILQRAMDYGAVNTAARGNHLWAHPIIEDGMRNLIFNKLKGAGGNMPPLAGNVQLTSVQHTILEKWKDGNFDNDWSGVPSPAANITPAELDKVSMDHCVGSAFFPGIEAGEILTQAALYSEPFRLVHDPSILKPGGLVGLMALPWQTDFNDCGTNWWPIPRPNTVFRQETNNYQSWTAPNVSNKTDMVTKWHTLGFIVEQNGQYIEAGKCNAPSIELLTQSLNFKDVPHGPNGMSRKTSLAIVFEVSSPDEPATFTVTSSPNHPRIEIYSTVPVVVPATAANEITPVRIYISYETNMGDTAPGNTIGDTVTIQHQESGREWVIPISANTIARKRAAVALVLDRSGSMNDDRGDGETKIQSLRDAASIFVDTMLEGDAASLVRYNHNAQIIKEMTEMGPAAEVGDPEDPARAATKSVINGAQLNPTGTTSIGDGIHQGRISIQNADGNYDLDALLVLTDGKENSPMMIADVAPDINERTYAVGLGTPENTSAATLQTISGNNGGYLLVTGALTSDKQFLLQKYFLQILAGISNAEIVLDPQGEVGFASIESIPFSLTEADYGIDVILLSPHPELIDFRLVTPSGLIIDPGKAKSDPSMAFVLSSKSSYYRLSLPIEYIKQRFDREGTWHILLRRGKKINTSHERRDDHSSNSTELSQEKIPYSVLVHSYSGISSKVDAIQTSYELGASIELRASLTEYGIPLDRSLQSWVEVILPDGSRKEFTLSKTANGEAMGSFKTSIAGVYQLRTRVRGISKNGHPFHRESTQTVSVWAGGDADRERGRNLTPRTKCSICCLLSCLRNFLLSFFTCWKNKHRDT